jgi:hypothetical protein
MLIIEGKLEGGQKAARPNLELQMPYFLEVFPEISGCYFGSLNIILNNPLQIANPDFVTKPIVWHPHHPDFVEVFHFTRVEIGLISNEKEKKYKAWVYEPQNSVNTFDIFLIEVICEKVNLMEVDSLKVYITQSFKAIQTFII